uniref:RING-CH-type domain-containing protein n=1 Tax=Tetradesmus obliquus TaxID=3088 RepID=A0A383W7B3_TETOB
MSTNETAAAPAAEFSRVSSCRSLDSNQPRCRLCWGGEDEGGQLISPCQCRGSMEFVHFGCLQHWLEVTRQQGRSRRSIRCEICKAKYSSTAVRSIIAGQEQQQQLLPGVWQDPFTVASIIHGAYRAYVAASGLLRAYAIYRSIQYPASCITGPPAGPAATGAAALPYYTTGRVGAASGAAAVGWPAQQQQQQQRRQRVQTPQEQQLLQHHLSVSIPLNGAAAAVKQLASGSSSSSSSSNKEVLDVIRQRFDSATMVQVYWYTALMALTPQPPNADAFAGMALGATIGGMMAQLVFLPMLGSGKLSALSHSCRLLLRCLVRLLAAEACQARGYRLLAAAVRALMQRQPQWRAGIRRRLRLPWVMRQQRQGQLEAAGAAAAAGDAGVEQQQQQQQ